MALVEHERNRSDRRGGLDPRRRPEHRFGTRLAGAERRDLAHAARDELRVLLQVLVDGVYQRGLPTRPSPDLDVAAGLADVETMPRGFSVGRTGSRSGLQNA